jgi:hypothetical protein
MSTGGIKGERESLKQQPKKKKNFRNINPHSLEEAISELKPHHLKK